jgi:hypothetical protein
MKHSNHAQHWAPAKPIPTHRRPDAWDYLAAACLVAILTVCALAYFDVLTK